jgi:hypothetical protein
MSDFEKSSNNPQAQEPMPAGFMLVEAIFGGYDEYISRLNNQLQKSGVRFRWENFFIDFPKNYVVSEKVLGDLIESGRNSGEWEKTAEYIAYKKIKDELARLRSIEDAAYEVKSEIDKKEHGRVIKAE